MLELILITYAISFTISFLPAILIGEERAVMWKYVLACAVLTPPIFLLIDFVLWICGRRGLFDQWRYR